MTTVFVEQSLALPRSAKNPSIPKFEREPHLYKSLFKNYFCIKADMRQNSAET